LGRRIKHWADERFAGRVITISATQQQEVRHTNRLQQNVHNCIRLANCSSFVDDIHVAICAAVSICHRVPKLHAMAPGPQTECQATAGKDRFDHCRGKSLIYQTYDARPLTPEKHGKKGGTNDHCNHGS
jgi:hypothetical protein